MAVAVYQLSVLTSQLAGNRVNRTMNSGMVPWEEPHHGDCEGSRVKRVVIVGLHEGLALFTPAPLHNLSVQSVPGSPPSNGIGFEVQLLRHLNPSIQRHPAHHLAENVVPDLSPDLPDTGVGQVPVSADPVDQPSQHPPRAFGHLVIAAPNVGRFKDLSIYVQLELSHCAVAHPDRP